MIGEALIDLFGELPKTKRRVLIHHLSTNLPIPLTDQIKQSFVNGAAEYGVDLRGLEQHHMEILAILTRHIDIPNDYLFMFGSNQQMLEETTDIRMEIVATDAGSPSHMSDGSHVRIADLAISSAHLARLHASYQLTMTHLNFTGPTSEPTVAVSSGSISLSLSTSGFGAGLSLVILALSGATLPIAVPVWAIAASGVAIAGTSAFSAIPEARKSWYEGTKAKEEAETERRRRNLGDQEAPLSGLAEKLGIPHEHVESLAADRGIPTAFAYLLINRLGPGILDAANDGVTMKTGESSKRSEQSKSYSAA